MSYERARDECFGLPRGGAIFGLLIGIIIVFVGLQQFFGGDIDIGPLPIIIIGILLAAGVIYGLSRARGRQIWVFFGSKKIIVFKSV